MACIYRQVRLGTIGPIELEKTDKESNVPGDYPATKFAYTHLIYTGSINVPDTVTNGIVDAVLHLVTIATKGAQPNGRRQVRHASMSLSNVPGNQIW